jgi:hypothetical protein
MEAMWRVLGFKTYPAPTPAVYLIKVKLPCHDSSYTENGMMTDMSLYFHRPEVARNLKYAEFHEMYICRTTISRRAMSHRQPGLIAIPGVTKTIYCTPRSPERKLIVRMEMLYPTAGEIWYLRTILLNRPCNNYLDARTFNGITYPSFQIAAVAQGYVQSALETSLCFQEAALFSTPAELRFLFATLSINGFPTLHIFNDELLFENMIADYRHNPSIIQSYDYLKNYLLIELQQIFGDNNKRLSDFNFPEPINYPSELVRERLKYNVQEQERKFDELNIAIPNNPE